jgi:hypothetical protein
MHARVFQQLVEVFLLVEQPRQRLSHWSQALAPLDGPKAPSLSSVDAYYDPASNQAIFGLRYDERALGSARLGFIIELSRLVEVGLIQPAELSDGDRRRFVDERLGVCTVHVGEQRKVVSALVELVRRVRAQRATANAPARRPTGRPLPRDTREPLLVAKGTSDLARGSVREPGPPQPAPDPDAAAIPEAELKRVISEPIATTPRRATAPAPHRRDEGPRPSPNVITRPGVHRANTVLMPSTEAQRILEAASESGEADVTTEPFLPTATEPPATDVIYARYLRSGRWIPIRIGSLSLKGAALMSAALPRVDDRVDVALSFANYRALVRGAVSKVSTAQEAALSGATTFHVTFELDDASRRQLTSLLTAARAANIMIKPPPARSTRRYLVEWPICLGTMRGAVRAEALDVSSNGMFVRPLHALSLDASVALSAVLDDGLPAVSGRARVVRTISDAEARIAGLSPGYGLLILDMPDPDRDRWRAFLARVEKRTSKRVLIGASPARLAELQSGLVAAGYAVTGGTERDGIAHLASAEARPVDAALIDAEWLAEGDSPAWVEQLFTGRNVPCVTMHGDARRARAVVDRLLAVV